MYISHVYCRPPSPPPKKQKIEEPSKIPDILQGEIARLDRRFRVKLDPLQHAGSKDIHLVCRLGWCILIF